MKTKGSLLDSQLERLSDFVAATMGLNFPRERWRDLETRMSSAAKEFGVPDVGAFVDWLDAASISREQVELLASHLTIAETYFWREPQVLEALRDQILPELIQLRQKKDKRLRLWSAGCATGEEPYSIAIALYEALPQKEDWNITVLATDINPHILRKAAAGVYGAWSFRNSPQWLRDGFFKRKESGKFEIVPEIRKMVKFAYLNLAEDIYPSSVNNTNAMDIIFCRNVLMYFTPQRTKQVVHNLYSSLVEGGWLMVAASELSQALFGEFASVYFPGAILYRRARPEPKPSAVNPFLATLPKKVGPTVLPSRSLKRDSKRVAAKSLSWEAAKVPAVFKKPQDADHVRDPKNEVMLTIKLMANQGLLNQASEACEKAIAGDKLDPRLHYLYATILQEQSREAEAVAALKRVLYLDPDFLLAHFALGNLVLRQENKSAAKKCFENVLSLLNNCEQDEVLPEAEGLTASRLKEIVHATMQVGALA